MNRLVFLILFLISLPVYPGSVTLAWDASPSVEVVGYKIYYGPFSGNYTNSAPVGKVLTSSVTNLNSGSTYYFAATAYNSSGAESPFSNEISYSTPPISFSPTISDIPNHNILINHASSKIPFTISDSDTAINLLTVSFSSSNSTLIDSNSFLLVGSGTNRNLYITPKTNQFGQSEITVLVKDDAGNSAIDKFIATVYNQANMTYIGVKLEYGTNLSYLSKTNIMVAVFSNAPINQFYRSSLIITNKPF